MIRKFFNSHWTTIASIILGLLSAIEQLGNNLQQLGWQLGPMAYMFPKNQKFFIGLTIASAACTFIAGLGKSILGLFQKKAQP